MNAPHQPPTPEQAGDARLERAQQTMDARFQSALNTPEQAGPSGEALADELMHDVFDYARISEGLGGFGNDRESIKQAAAEAARKLRSKIRAALASPGAMEGAQAAQPLTDRQQRVVTFALSRFASGARSRAEAAAQDKQERYFKPGDVAAFLRDAEDAEALLKVDLLRAHQPTGEPT